MADEDIPSIVLTFKYRVLASKRQHEALAAILEMQRQLYNAALAERIDCYRKTGGSITYIDQCKSLTIIRRECEGWDNYPVALQRGTLRRLDEAFQGFFRRVKRGDKAGFPRFKSKSRYSTLQFTEFSGVTFDTGRLRMKGLPGGLRVHLHRPMPEGQILTCKLCRDHKGWFVCFSIRMVLPELRHAVRMVGVDVGIKTLAMLSTGESIPNPRAAKRAERELRRRQRALARCKRGSKRRAKVRQQVARCHAKIKNTRRTYLHQVSARMVRDYDLIAVEKLNNKGLCRGMLARDVHDAGWATLKEMLTYKAANAGVRLIEVSAKNTTQACSGCGAIVAKTLDDRWHHCPHCGLSLDRDHNSALVILRKGVLALEQLNVAECRKRVAENITLAGSK